MVAPSRETSGANPVPSAGQQLRRIASMVGGFGLRAVLQGLSVILLSRELGAAQFGLFVTILALCMIVAPLAGLGGWARMLRDVARTPEVFALRLGESLYAFAASAPLVALAAVAGCHRVVPAIDMVTIVAIALAEIVCFPLNDLAVRAFQSFDRTTEMLALNAAPVVARVLVLLGLVTMDAVTLQAWALGHLGAALLALAASAAYMVRCLGAPRFVRAPLLALARDGMPFALGISVTRMQSEAEKPMLGALASSGVAGAYAVASRLVDVLLMPINAAVEASFSAFFRAGAAGAPVALALARRLLGWLLLYAGGCVAAIAVAAPWLPRLLGPSYAQASGLALSLAGLPLVYGVYSIVGMIPQSMGRQREIVPAVTVGGLVKIATGWVLIPHHGALGAVAATYATFAVVAGWLAVAHWRHSRTRPTACE